MIDLKKRGLQDTIIVDGRPFLLNTSFRVWLDFPQAIQGLEDLEVEKFTDLFVDEVPPITQECIQQLMEFYHQPSEIPRPTGKETGAELLDYDYDSDYVFAGFYQTYGINLAREDLHWHEYQALFAGLPSDTMIVQIMGYRGYDGNSKDYDYKQRIQQQRAWSLPRKRTAEEEKLNDAFEANFV